MVKLKLFASLVLPFTRIFPVSEAVDDSPLHGQGQTWSPKRRDDSGGPQRGSPLFANANGIQQQKTKKNIWFGQIIMDICGAP